MHAAEFAGGDCCARLSAGGSPHLGLSLQQALLQVQDGGHHLQQARQVGQGSSERRAAAEEPKTAHESFSRP